MNKKKYHGGLFLFFATLCALLFINTCSFANTNVTREYLEWIWDYQLNNTNYVTIANTNCNSNKTFISNNFNKDTCITDIYNKLSQYQQNNNITQFGNVNLSVFPRFNDYTMAWFFVLSNSGAPSGLDDVSGFLYVKSPDNFGTLEDNLYIMKVYFNGLNGTGYRLSYQYETRTSLVTDSNLSNIFINNSLDVVTIRNCCFAGIPHGYYYYNNNYIPVLFQSLGGNFVPSQNNGAGDNNSGEVVGDITNSSGENTGNINLQPIVDGLGNIQNQISGDTTRIIENQNNNTNTIVNTISGESTKIINTITDDNIDEVTDSLNSGEYQNNSASANLNALTDAFFNSSGDFEEDFIISWNGVDYMGVNLIPSGEINFTQFVESDEQINTIYRYYKMFCQISFGFILVSSYYNLFLSTLGLGSYFAMNTDVEDDSINSVSDNDIDYELSYKKSVERIFQERKDRYGR